MNTKQVVMKPDTRDKSQFFNIESSWRRLCNDFFEKYPKGSVPDHFNAELIEFIFMQGVSCGGMDSQLFDQSLDYFSSE